MVNRSSPRFGRAAARAVALSAVITAGSGLTLTPAAHASSHAGTVPSAGAAITAQPVALSEAPPTTTLLRKGDSGQAVRDLQTRLRDLGYWVGPVDGEFGTLTTQAVYALQKAAGIGLDGIVGPRTREALADEVRPDAATTTGDVVEVDLDRQLLLVVSDGTVEQVMHTSTGSGEEYRSGGVDKVAVTPTGEYSVFRGVDGWDPGPLGALYRPKYFNGGIAVHGYPSVPTRPASHGCVRVSLAAMDWLWESGGLAYNTTVLVR